MFKCLVLMAITVPILVYSADGETTKPPKLMCYQNENVELALKSFQAILQTSINETLVTKSNKNVNATVIEAANEVTEIAGQTCLTKNNRTNTLNYTDFITLLDFSLKDQKYYNFTITGGTTCINETRFMIHQCINETVGYANTTEMPEIRKLLKKSALSYTASTCAQTRHLRNCTAQVLNNSTLHCKKHHVDYVTSLFDFALQNSPCVKFPTDFKATNSASSVMFNSAVIVIAFLITLY